MAARVAKPIAAWHHKPVIVVGMLADQIDSPGRAKNPGLGPIQSKKIGPEFVNRGHNPESRRYYSGNRSRKCAPLANPL